jgi:Phytanoyl-CoA dioxygenase (PhyH)
MPQSWAGWWKAPWWVLQLATGAKSFADNPILGSARLNRRGLHRNRMAAAHRLAWWRRAQLARHVDPADRAAFDRDGYVAIPDFLPSAEFTALRDRLLNLELPSREQRQGGTLTRRAAIDGPLRASLPTLDALLRSRRWTALMRYVASTSGEPVYYLQTIVTDPDGPPDPQFDLHSDAFHPSLKAWLFLTDVEPGGSPLVYVPGSHRLTPARAEWERQRSASMMTDGDRLSQRGSLRIAPEELAGLGLPEAKPLLVPGNTLVVADTCGFHARGRPTRATTRVEIWAYRRRSPFLPWTRGDLLSLPGIAQRRIGWLFALTDWLAARGLRQQHWQSVGRRKAL